MLKHVRVWQIAVVCAGANDSKQWLRYVSQ